MFYLIWYKQIGNNTENVWYRTQGALYKKTPISQQKSSMSSRTIGRITAIIIKLYDIKMFFSFWKKYSNILQGHLLVTLDFFSWTHFFSIFIGCFNFPQTHGMKSIVFGSKNINYFWDVFYFSSNFYWIFTINPMRKSMSGKIIYFQFSILYNESFAKYR